jgi:hypothetical protein
VTAFNTAFNTALYLRHLSNTYIYYRAHGRLPDYAAPRLFTEKIQWRKLFDRNPLFPCLVDKLAVRGYVQRRAPTLKLPETLWIGNDPDAIPYAALPERFVLKPSHRSGDVLFVRSRKDLDHDRVAAICRRWLNSPYGRSRREWAYQGLTGRLIIEEMLRTGSGPDCSRDYRCHVFDGVVAAILVIAGTVDDGGHRFTGEALAFDRTWNRLPYHRLFDRASANLDAGRPAPLDRMIAVADLLGRGIDYVRLDCFVIRRDVYFGELTIYPGSGMNTVPIDTKIAGPATGSYDAFLGKMWELPEISLHDRLKRGLLGA